MGSNLEIARSYLESGGSICPFASRCYVHYEFDTGDFRPILSNFEHGQAIVAVSRHYPNWLLSFEDMKTWARSIFVKIMRHAARLSNPGSTDREIVQEIMTNIYPILENDSDQRRPNIALRNEPVITICMAPVYPITHPRYSPVPMLVLTWYEDLKNAGIFPKVRRAMEQEHGHVYDALELMLPMPPQKEA